MTADRPPDPDGAPGLAVVTGASTGIGKEVARCLVEAGHDVVVVADEPDVHAAASELGAGGTRVVAVQADLATAEGVEEVHRAVLADAVPLEVLVLNAGVGTSGRTLEVPLEDDLRVVDLNVRSTVHLAKLLVPGLVERGRGRVLVTSSIAGFAPGPYQATYNASKSFVHLYAQALRHELEGTGVTVTSLQPGPTDTPFFDRAGMRDTRLGGQLPKDDPAVVARQACAAMTAGRAQVVGGGPVNLVSRLVSQVVPDRVSAAAMSLVTKPLSSRTPSNRTGDSA